MPCHHTTKMEAKYDHSHPVIKEKQRSVPRHYLVTDLSDAKKPFTSNLPSLYPANQTMTRTIELHTEKHTEQFFSMLWHTPCYSHLPKNQKLHVIFAAKSNKTA